MAEGWPKKRRLLGTKVKRLDGPEKATGRAKYSYDVNRPGMLHGAILRSPYAHAKVKSIDTTAARKVPGFKAVALVGGSRDGTVVEADPKAGTLVYGIPIPAKKNPPKKDDKTDKKEDEPREEKITVKVMPGVTLISKNKVVKLADLKPGDPVTVEDESALVGKELYYAGDEVLAVAADTEEQ